MRQHNHAMRARGLMQAALVAMTTVGLLGGQAVVADAAPLQADTRTAAPVQCADAHLKIRVHFDAQASGAGQRLAHVDFQNTGAVTCTLHGAPGVSLVGHGDGTQLGRPADRPDTGTAPLVRLGRGQSARADLQFVDVDAGGGPYDTACRAVKADGYRIYPPHSRRAAFIPSPQYACTDSTIHWGSVGSVAGKPIGCAATDGGVPKGATRKSIADVDGDWNADTAWITPTRFGITTASGTTSAIKPAVAGAGYPSALDVVLRNTRIALTIIAGSRDAQLLRFDTSTCTLKPVLNKQGHQYRFDLTGRYGDGVACTDPDLNGVDQITGTRLSRPVSSLRDGDTDTVSSTVIGIHGLHAVNGATRSRTFTWPADREQLDAAATVTCRGLSINIDGITAHHA